MKTLSNVLATGVVAVAALAFGGVAQAATLSVGPTTLGQTTTDFNLPLSPLAQFNPSLGTLTSVTILRNGSMNTAGTLTNNSTSSGNFTTRVEANLGVTVAGTTETFANLFVSRSLTLQSVTNAPANSGTFSGTDTDTLTTVLNSGFAAFIGTGTVPVSCETAVGQFSGGPGGNASSTNTTTAGCDVTITYTYTEAPVGTPEPGMLLGLLSVAGVGAFARRKS